MQKISSNNYIKCNKLFTISLQLAVIIILRSYTYYNNHHYVTSTTSSNPTGIITFRLGTASCIVIVLRH